jgi:hypothetical protein
MAYPLDVAAQNAGLKAWFGDGRAASVPASWEFALFTGHPLYGGTELTTAGGYAPVVVANTSANFPDPVDGVITAAGITFAAPTAAYSDVAPYFVLREPSAGPTWYVGAFPDGQPVDIQAAQPAFIIKPAIRWNTEGA